VDGRDEGLGSGQWCSGAGTHRNAVPVDILGPERLPVVIRFPRRNAIAAAFRQMFAVKIGFYSEIRPCLM